MADHVLTNEDLRQGLKSADEADAWHRYGEGYGDLRRTVEKAITALEAETLPRKLADMLHDPNAVHLMMLRGTIALPSVDQIRHIYGDRLKEGSK